MTHDATTRSDTHADGTHDRGDVDARQSDRATVSDTERDSRRRDNSTRHPARPRSSGTPCGTTSDTCRTAAAGRRPCRWRSRTSGPTAGTRGGGGTRHASASTLATHVANTSRAGRRAVGLRINEIDGFIRQFIIEGGLPVYRGWSTTPLSPHPSPALPSSMLPTHLVAVSAHHLPLLLVARVGGGVGPRPSLCAAPLHGTPRRLRGRPLLKTLAPILLLLVVLLHDLLKVAVRHQLRLSTQRLIDSRAD